MKAYLVTGASTGIGRATAERLAGAGHQVFGSVRSDEHAAELRDGPRRIEPLTLDVTDAGSIAAAAERIASVREGAGLDGLVNNAGTAFAGPLEYLPIDDLRQQIEINLIGQVAVTKALLPELRRARGRVVFVSSIGGRIALPFNGAYNASKFGIEAIGDSLRQELRPFGMEVILVEPGAVATPIWDKGVARANEVVDLDSDDDPLYGRRLRSFRELAVATGRGGIAPDEVAAVIEEALTKERPRTRYLVGRDAKIRARLRRVVGDRAFDRLVARQIDR